MKKLEKNLVEQYLGKKYGLMSGKSLRTMVKYLGGIPEIDKMVQENKLNPEIAAIVIEMRHKGLEVTFLQIPHKTRIGILSEEINYWTIEQHNEIIEKKSKSVVGRALLGGVLLGPVGAIVGGMTGIGDKAVAKSSIDNILTISCNEDGKEVLVLFSYVTKNAKYVSEYFKKIYPEKYQSPEEIVFEVPDQSEEAKFSVADELKKLKELLDGGILTDEEFNAQKSKLLNR